LVFLGRPIESHTQHGESSGIAVDPDETGRSVNGVNAGEGDIQKKSRRQFEKSPQGTTAGNRQDEETTPVVDPDTEPTEPRRTSDPATSRLLNHESTFLRDLPSSQSHSEERIDEVDPGPGANSDIYESDQELEGIPVEESSFAAEPSRGLIGSVAASIGNVVRGAAGRAPS
jgi:hypothetical protein